jgi:hypothetical protein
MTLGKNNICLHDFHGFSGFKPSLKNVVHEV